MYFLDVIRMHLVAMVRSSMYRIEAEHGSMAGTFLERAILEHIKGACTVRINVCEPRGSSKMEMPGPRKNDPRKPGTEKEGMVLRQSSMLANWKFVRLR